jgi:hypothetical protein
MPVYKKGGEVQETYGLENAAEMIRRQGRDGDTVLAHISPEEAGILKLLGGSGTINPYTGLPEYKSFLKKIIPKPIYKLGSEVGKAVERGVESIAKNEVLGPIAQIAAAYFGGPIGAGLYAGLAKPGSSFDVKNAAKAAALTYAGQQISQGLGQTGTPSEFGGPGGYGPGAFDSGMGLDAMSGGPGVVPSTPYYGPGAFDAGVGLDAMSGGPGTLESAVSSAGNAPFATGPEVVNAGITPPIESGVDISQIPPSGPTEIYSTAPAVTTPTPTTPTAPGGGMDMMGADYNYGRGAPIRDIGIDSTGGLPASPSVGEGILGLGEAAAEAAYGLASRNPMTTAGIAYGGYTAYKTKQEIDAAKEEAERILADQANRKQEEINWARGIMSTYAPNYARLTEEDVLRERGLLAVGGRINSYDDEIGGDDNMMQGGIASLAKGGLPPRYLRGGGDGMSDSIRANIDGKQEARLADGEFVVPADVVSHLGNGSSNAGAKKLYSMMDRVRKSRTGKTRQAPEVNTRRLMPA